MPFPFQQLRCPSHGGPPNLSTLYVYESSSAGIGTTHGKEATFRTAARKRVASCVRSGALPLFRMVTSVKKAESSWASRTVLSICSPAPPASATPPRRAACVGHHCELSSTVARQRSPCGSSTVTPARTNPTNGNWSNELKPSIESL